MDIPLKDTKILLSNTVSLDLKFIDYDKIHGALKFSMHSLETFIKFQQIHSTERTYIFATDYDGKVYKWVGNITSLAPTSKTMIIKNTQLMGVKQDQRKPRIKVRDRVSIIKMEFDQKVLDLTTQPIPALTFDLSESGLMLYTTYNFGEVSRFDDHRIYIRFEGSILGELGVKSVRVKRFFQEGNMFYYGCQLEINGFDDMKQIHKILQTLKFHQM